MDQTNHFFNLGYGWLCKHCSADDAERRQDHSSGGLFGRSESQKKETSHGLALATWTDSSRHALICPRCGIHETVNT